LAATWICPLAANWRLAVHGHVTAHGDHEGVARIAWNAIHRPFGGTPPSACAIIPQSVPSFETVTPAPVTVIDSGLAEPLR
jgi:hypothetical protein